MAETWLTSAPHKLIEQYAATSVGRDILRRLLTGPKMEKPWHAIEKRISELKLRRQDTYDRLWGFIRWALRKANRDTPKTVKNKKREMEKIARDAVRLAERIGTPNHPLDVLAHQLFPTDVIRLTRRQGAAKEAALALEWTTFAEMLMELSRRASTLAAQKPIVVQATYRYRSNLFIRLLGDYFNLAFGGSMRASLATMTSVILEETVTEDDVRRALAPVSRDRKRPA